MVSLNNDRDPGPEDNLRQFVFKHPSADFVYIEKPVYIPDGRTAINRYIKAYEKDKTTPFVFGRRRLPATGLIMYFEGKRRSRRVNDIGFEFQYFKGKKALCGGGAQGTVVEVKGKLTMSSGSGAPFTRQNKMLIAAKGKASATIRPNIPHTLRWHYDVAGMTFTAPNAKQTNFTAPSIITPTNRLNQNNIKLEVKLQGTNQIIEIATPVNLTSPQHMQENRTGVTTRTGWLRANRGRINLINTLFQYELLDQWGISLRQGSAFAKSQTRARENIAQVLQSPIPGVMQIIRNNLNHSPNFTAARNGRLRDRIRVYRLNKLLLTQVIQGRRSFVTSLQTVGGVIANVPPTLTHIWEMCVRDSRGRLHSGDGTANYPHGTENSFSSTVSSVRQTSFGTEIRIDTTYTVNTP